VGSHLVERLMRDGAHVLCVSRSGDHRVTFSQVDGDCEFALSDITDAEQITHTLTAFRPAVVFHLAACRDGAESGSHRATCLNVNQLGTINVLEAARRANAQSFIYAHSSKVYGNASFPHRLDSPAAPICSYAIAKSAAWQFCQMIARLEADIELVGLCPTFIYGLRQNWNLIAYVYDCVRQGRPVKLSGGSQTRDPVFVDDAVDAFVRASLTPPKCEHAIPIGGGHEITVLNFCRAILRSLRSDLPIEEGAQTPRPTEIWRSCADNSAASHYLDWMPRTSLISGLEILAEQIRESVEQNEMQNVMSAVAK
jgi:nucleoside-diphosphate-sugar epimerase